MAITIETQPAVTSPAGNPLLYLVSSNNTAQANFRYVFDLYESTGVTLLLRVKLPARPADNKCLFDASQIIRSYISYNLPTLGENGWKQNTTSYYPWQIKIGEEYGSTVTVHAALAVIPTNYGWNAGIKHVPFISYGVNSYVIRKGVTGGQPLTDAPQTQYLDSTDNAFLYFMVNPSGATSAGAIKTLKATKYNSAGTSLGTLSIDNSFFACTANSDKFLRIGTGPANINAYSAAWIDASVDHYTVQVFDNTGTPVATSLLYTYYIQADCRFDGLRLHWLNKLGGFDSFTFTLKAREKVNVTRSKYRKVDIPDTASMYTASGRGDTSYDVRSRSNIIGNSDWISEAQSAWLEDLFTSPEVYMETGGNLIPVTVMSQSYDIQKKQNQQLFNVPIEVQLANEEARYNGG